MLTLFGRKKKEDKEEAKEQPQIRAQSAGTGRPGTTTETGRPADGIEDSTLSKLLQSIMQDIPINQTNDGDRVPRTRPATSDFVPHRTTPPSRPMVIVSDDKGKKLVEAKESNPPKPVQRPMGSAIRPAPSSLLEPEVHLQKQAEPVPRSISPAGPAVRPVTSQPIEPERPSTSSSLEPSSLSAFPKLASLEEEMRRLEEEVKKNLAEPEKTLPSKEVKQEKRESEKTRIAKPAYDFNHVFELTQGTLKSPGLVLTLGPEGSGKTTLCSSLTGAFLQQGIPCFFVTYDKSSANARGDLKKAGCDISAYESQFRFLMVDGFSTQSDAFSMEPYYVEKPFDVSSLQDAVLRNAQIFMGEHVCVVLDSLDGFLGRIPAKDFVKGFRELVEKLKASGITLLASVDSEKLSKDFDPLEEMADCVIELEKSGSNAGVLRVVRLNGSDVKAEPQQIEFTDAKGIVFV